VVERRVANEVIKGTFDLAVRGRDDRDYRAPEFLPLAKKPGICSCYLADEIWEISGANDRSGRWIRKYAAGVARTSNVYELACCR
jgi:hypothetical protein